MQLLAASGHSEYVGLTFGETSRVYSCKFYIRVPGNSIPLRSPPRQIELAFRTRALETHPHLNANLAKAEKEFADVAQASAARSSRPRVICRRSSESGLFHCGRVLCRSVFARVNSIGVSP